MSYDPMDPGPVLETYDPDWAARFHAAETMLEVLTARADPRRDHVLRTELTEDLCSAFEAQFQYSWELDAFLRDRYGLVPHPGEAMDLRMPSPPHDASPAEMKAHYASWRERLEARRFIASLPPLQEWETGVFATTTVPRGVTREVREAVVERLGMDMPVRMRVVVERHPGTTHVCAVQGPESGAPVLNHVALVADWVAERYLPRPGLLARLGRSRQRLVLHHTRAPEELGPSRQLVWAHALRWGRRAVRIHDLETREATPYLRDQAVQLIPGVGTNRAAA